MPFQSLPNLDWDDPNVRFVDLTGDGRADVLITEHDALDAGTSPSARTASGRPSAPAQPLDEEAGPRLVFADQTRQRVPRGHVGRRPRRSRARRRARPRYWPNRGYGEFGAKVSVGNAPVLDHPESFDGRRVRLADVDGSGPVDLLYLGREGAKLYVNRSGNSLSDALPLDLPEATSNLAAVQVADLLGNGTACLVFNSHLPGDARRPVRYVDLMAQGKPHLLTGVDNNLGAAVTVDYTPSTRFYVADKLAGRPWITRLPFPVLSSGARRRGRCTSPRVR